MQKKKSKAKEKDKIYTHVKKGPFAALFKIMVVNILIRKMEFIFHDGKPEEPAALVCNHTKIMAPLVLQYMYPGNLRTWSNARLTHKTTCLEMLTENVEGIKQEKLYKFLLPIFAPLFAYYFREKLNCIPVYHDLRVKHTFEESVRTLENGSHIAIYPEKKAPAVNEVLCPFASGFVYLAYNYYNETGKRLKFYPVYCAFSLRQTHIGKPVEYDPGVNIKKQAADVADYLASEITNMARSLPPHKISHLLNDFNLEEK